VLGCCVQDFRKLLTTPRPTPSPASTPRRGGSTPKGGPAKNKKPYKPKPQLTAEEEEEGSKYRWAICCFGGAAKEPLLVRAAWSVPLVCHDSAAEEPAQLWGSHSATNPSGPSYSCLSMHLPKAGLAPRRLGMHGPQAVWALSRVAEIRKNAPLLYFGTLAQDLAILLRACTVFSNPYQGMVCHPATDEELPAYGVQTPLLSKSSVQSLPCTSKTVLICHACA